jgi:hypothetical protein
VIVWWLFPIAYLVCDFVEDALIASLLSWPGLLNPLSFSILRAFTITKIATVTIAFLQSGALLLGWVAARLGIV